MPELPEVETIRKGLEGRLVGRRISSIEIRYAGSWGTGDSDTAIGTTVEEVTRYGKLLVIMLSNNMGMTIHLKMTGQLIWKAQESDEAVMGGHPTKAYLEDLPHKHTHVIFTFDDGSHLYFNDLRKFGTINLLPSKEINKIPFIQSLGPEPLSTSFTVDYLSQRVAKRPQQPIKVFLLDQTNIAGIGNIYADESLFTAGILPSRLAGSLRTDEVALLHKAIPAVLKNALAHGGSSRKDYVNAVGEKGTFLGVAQVYQRAGQPCMVCGTPIEKIKLGGRSTHYCPVCQN